MKGRTLRQQWEAFSQRAMPAQASKTQRRRLERTFYAGAQALMAIQLDMAHNGVSDDEGTEKMAALHEECRRFNRDVHEGRA